MSDNSVIEITARKPIVPFRLEIVWYSTSIALIMLGIGFIQQQPLPWWIILPTAIVVGNILSLVFRRTNKNQIARLLVTPVTMNIFDRNNELVRAISLDKIIGITWRPWNKQHYFSIDFTDEHGEETSWSILVPKKIYPQNLNHYVFLPEDVKRLLQKLKPYTTVAK